MNVTFSDLDSIIQLSKDSDTLGFDLNTGQTWIYPTNYQIRDYQFNITQAALHNNTLVSLPTGLGKTFIAAVIMYNFYRWYPMGKIIFMAPTRPLVKQQQDACYNITAIPPDATAEMTGNKVKESRVKIWKEKRVFFITPQILQNDIDVVLDLAQQIKCIVIDEAHRALGKHANCEAIKKIHKINKYFRVLALSATPGSNFNSVKDVITNLLISRIEARTNESIDVAPYVFNRKLETFVIPITGELLTAKNKYIMILDKYTRPLLQFNIFSGNCANLTKGRIVLIMKEFKERGRQHAKYGFILKSLNLCVTLYHGYELLIRHGLRGFLVFFDGTISKPLINSIHELHEILNDVRNYLGPLEEIEMLPDGIVPEVEGPVVYSHPKFKKLNEILIDHFKTTEESDTRVMVFCEYRESVMEIYQMLLRQRPLIKPRVFLGQGAISQAKQIQAIKQFKSGVCNTLISTCIGEEGLDVGEVDLIVCLDISSKSPIRMVQRMGRTGRKRDGRVVVLVTEGKEQQLLSECMVQKNNMISILESQPIKQHLYTNNPIMIPDYIKPECNKMFITVKEPEKPKKKEESKKKSTASKNANTLKSMFDNISSQSSSKILDDDQGQRAIKNHKSPIKASRGTKKIKTLSKNQLDLRNMFSKINNTQCTINSSQVYTQESNDSKIEECTELNILVKKIKSYLNTSIINKSSCKICDIFNNKILCSTTNNTITDKWTKPNLSILESITSESLTKFAESITLFKSTTFNASNKYTTFNENLNPNRTPYNHSSVKTNNGSNSLQFFNLESTCDIFSDDSTEAQEYDDPIIFRHSFGIFESSNIYHTPVKTNIYETTELNSEQNIFESEDILNNTKENEDLFENEEDLIIISGSESTSPILCTQRFGDYKEKIQRRLFSQQNTDSTSNTVGQQCQQTISSEINKFGAKSDKLPTDKQNALQQNKKDNFKNIIVSTPKCATDFNVTKECEINFNSTVINTTPTPYNPLATKKPDILKNISTPKNTTDFKNDNNMDFWDESLFEICDSDESMFEDDNKSPKCTEKQIEIIDKKLNNSNENKEGSDNDSDATIILSFSTDQIFEDIKQDDLKNESIEQFTKPVTLNVKNKSLCNKTTDSSLLSVTQAIELLNDSKFKSLDSSVKINEHKNFETLNQSLRIQTLNNKSSETEENLNNSVSKTISVKINSNEITTNIDNIKNYAEVNKKESKNNVDFDDLEISEIFKDFDDESEEEYSLLNFSQNRKRKLYQNQNNSATSNIAKFARTTIDKDKSQNTQHNTINSNNNIENMTNTNCDNKKTDNFCEVSNVLKDKSSDNDFKEHSLLNFSQKNMKMQNKNCNLTIMKKSDKKSNDINKISTQLNSVQLPSKKVTNTNVPVIVLSDSDDDFEVKPTIKPVSKLITPVKKLERVNSIPSYSKSENTNKNAKTTANRRKSRSRSCRTRMKNINSNKKSACAFIDDEATVENDEHYVSDSDSDKNSDEQLLDSSFVSYTQNIHDQTDMRAKYLQSIRSPKFKPGAFKIPHRPPPEVYDVFSQIENYENETYMDDSFCVGNDQSLTEREGMSYLEVIEDQLEKENTKKRNKKRKRIITLSDSD